MPSLTGKKIILLGVVIVLLVAIPLTVFLVGQQQKTETSAVAATNLTFNPTSKQIKLGDTITLDANLDPSTNQVSFVKVIITYDETKLATDGAGFVPNTIAFRSVLQGPVYNPGTILVTLSTGGSPQDIIVEPTKLGTLSFKAVGTTDNAPTQIGFGNQTQVLSITQNQDEFNENVLSSATPANITISSSETLNAVTSSPTPITPPGATVTLTPTPTTVQTATAVLPVCSSLTITPSASGSAPYTANLQ